MDFSEPRLAIPPTSYRGLSGHRARVSWECPRECPRKRGVPDGVSPRGVSGAFRALGSGVSKKCPESVPRVPNRCPEHSGPEGPQRHLVGHSVGHPRFRGHSRGHSPGHSGPRGPRDPCSWSAGLFRASPFVMHPVHENGSICPCDFSAERRSPLRSRV